MNINDILFAAVKKALQKLYDFEPSDNLIQLQNTRKDFEGDITLVVFPILKFSKKAPDKTAEEVGNELQNELEYVDSFNVIKGFLNLVISDKYWYNILSNAYQNDRFGIKGTGDEAKTVMIEYSSPNTNKPLHLGHIRNNLLGHSLSEILKASGNKVIKTNIVNDRGIHICKSMYAWQKWGNGETPESSGIKGDHLVGKYYVEFNKQYNKEIQELINKGFSKEEAENKAPSIQASREMLRKWEANDEQTVQLWKKMNSWVYDGFNKTYSRLGVEFDKIYYESQTYLAGRDEVLRGLEKGIFYKKDDGSVWADLTEEGLDNKILLRSDGTSVYITQDIGTAKMRYNDFYINEMIYVVGNEQNYHFQVLAILLDKLGFSWGKELNHFSYGMVELPSGKMKSREGTVVDADDLMDEMVKVAQKMSEDLGKLDTLTEEEKQKTFEIIALGALKYFILKVDPKKNMLFNPEESIDFNGNTGSFIQYTHARIQSVLRKAQESNIKINETPNGSDALSIKEKEILKRIAAFPETIEEAAVNYSPAIVANYCYELAKEFNQFYHDHTILGEQDLEKRNFRLVLSNVAGKTIKIGMSLLGIEVPERM